VTSADKIRKIFLIYSKKSILWNAIIIHLDRFYGYSTSRPLHNPTTSNNKFGFQKVQTNLNQFMYKKGLNFLFALQPFIIWTSSLELGQFKTRQFVLFSNGSGVQVSGIQFPNVIERLLKDFVIIFPQGCKKLYS
jgi:hypothetical protein